MLHHSNKQLAVNKMQTQPQPPMPHLLLAWHPQWRHHHQMEEITEMLVMLLGVSLELVKTCLPPFLRPHHLPQPTITALSPMAPTTLEEHHQHCLLLMVEVRMETIIHHPMGPLLTALTTLQHNPPPSPMVPPQQLMEVMAVHLSQKVRTSKYQNKNTLLVPQNSSKSTSIFWDLT